ncbi:MAG: small multi-drug export protein [Anaerovoracaceae bacterium]|nr:small multi-drug export protein [Bacillota bacterium]MDD7735094.1 small multi-drug export protein [Bacillota bacterium]MDY5906834.1 small multi-drug export protein [Anaerovoracaceae bacterium]
MLATLEADYIGRVLLTFLVSMVPVVELRGGIPFGTALGLDPVSAAVAAILGNLVPVPFIILFIRHIFDWLRRYDKPRALVEKFEKKAHLKSKNVIKYQTFGLCLFVALPLPGTGAWTGALIAAILDMRLKRAMPSIILGVIIAATIVTCVTRGVVAALF